MGDITASLADGAAFFDVEDHRRLAWCRQTSWLVRMTKGIITHVPTASSEVYVRLQAAYVGRLGVNVGIFVAVDHLRRAGRLSVDEENLYFDVDDWFRSALPQPPFYDDGNSLGAVTWFKTSTAVHMLARLAPLQGILTKYRVEHSQVASSDPGTIIYEDDFQVGVVPYRRAERTPLPEGLVLGPTTAGCKRHLGKASRP